GGKGNGTLPSHHSEDIEREQRASGMNLGIGFLQECGDYVGALRSVWSRIRRGQFRGTMFRLGGPLGFGGCDGFALLRFGGTDEASVATWAAVVTSLVCVRCVTVRGCEIFLEDETRVFLVAFSGESYIVELNFIGAELGYVLGEGDIVILNFRVGGVGPDEFAVLAPR